MIIGLGCIAHDLILVTETSWESGKGRVIGSEGRFGGNVRNALATVAALEHPAGYLGAVGTSPLGDDAVADLVLHGISTRFVERVSGADPVTSRITVTGDGERYVAFDDAPLAMTPLPHGVIVDQALDDADALLVDACVAPPGSIGVLEQARERGIPVVLDAERDPTPTLRALVEVADHLVIPLRFGAVLTGFEGPTAVADALWNDGRAAVVLTDGIAGAHAYSAPGEHLHLPAYPARAIDTTGCGDAFHGAYAWALVSGADLGERVRIASAAAAVIAALPAGARRVATRAAMDAFLVDS